MKVEQFRNVVERLENDTNNLKEYFNALRNVDSSMPEFLLANYPYNTVRSLADFILEEYMGEEIFRFIQWYLDRETYLDTVLVYDNMEYEIVTLDDFVEFMKDCFEFEE